MSLRYSFRHLFFGGKLRPRRLYQILDDLDKANSGETTDITALKTAVGNSSSGLVKDVADINTAIGKASGDGAGGILKDVKDIQDTIGDSTDPAEGTIEARLQALENPTTQGDG